MSNKEKINNLREKLDNLIAEYYEKSLKNEEKISRNKNE